MKKFISIVLCLVLCVSFVACGSGGSDSDTAADDQILIRIASDEAPDTPGSLGSEKFKELVEEKSEGKIKVEVYHDAAMGDEKELSESVSMGNLEMALISAAFWSNYDDNWFVVDLPYVWPDRETTYEYLDGDVGTTLKDSLMEQSGIKVLDFCDGGFKCISSKAEIFTVDDLHGKKIRCMDTQMCLDLYKAWDASAVPMGASEVYTALQQGTVDGADTAPIYQTHNKFMEVTDYFTLTNHQMLLLTSAINGEFFDNLSEELQQVIVDCSKEAFAGLAREEIEKQDDESIQAMLDSGSKECEMTEAQKKTFIDAAKPVVETYRSKVSEDLYKALGL